MKELLEEIVEQNEEIIKALGRIHKFQVKQYKNTKTFQSDKYEQFKKGFLNSKSKFWKTSLIIGKYDISRVTALRYMRKLAEEVGEVKFIENQPPHGCVISKG